MCQDSVPHYEVVSLLTRGVGFLLDCKRYSSNNTMNYYMIWTQFQYLYLNGTGEVCHFATNGGGAAATDDVGDTHARSGT